MCGFENYACADWLFKQGIDERSYRTSEKEPHKITGLVVGKTYQLVETLPADGYVTAETIEFTIEDASEVQPIEMKDDITKLKIPSRTSQAMNWKVRS